MKTIVVSAVNLKVGGTLTILRDCLRYLSAMAGSGDFRIVALVYKKDLAFHPNIEYIEMRWPKRNWVNRLWCEYVSMKKISKRLSPVYLWLSLHDTTPNVVSEHQAVYCHNPFPFYKWKMHEWLFTPKIVLFALFSKYAYGMNIHKNRYVVVQQDWIRQAFVRMFRLKPQSVVVAPPVSEPVRLDDIQTRKTDEAYSFIYASSPNSHKNFECLCRAVEILSREFGVTGFKAYITVKGEENAYAKWLRKNWGHLPGLEFVGFLSRNELYDYYHRSHCLVFPSKAETWGLPITEFKAYDKPMLLSDLPYAHETGGGSHRVAFFDPEKPGELALQMKRLIEGDSTFLRSVEKPVVVGPMAESWQELFELFLNE